jgi:hypothetical protein
MAIENNMGSVSATPATPTSIGIAFVSSSSTTQVKSATKDIILFDDGAVPVELMADLIFENIGGQELINIARRDTVNGQKISYQPIKNLSSIEQQYTLIILLAFRQPQINTLQTFLLNLTTRFPKQERELREIMCT